MEKKGILTLILYLLSSSSLLVVNKWAIMLVQKPSVLLLLQTSASVVITLALWVIGMTHLNRPTRETVQGYMLVSLVFIATIFANVKVLQLAGVNLFIVLRCSTPILVAVLDFVFLGRELPDKRSLTALFALAMSGTSYAHLRSSSQSSTSTPTDPRYLMFWCIAWVTAFVVEMTFTKHIVDKTKVSGWAGTLLQNAFASVWMGMVVVVDVLCLSSKEDATAYSMDAPSVLVVGASCLIGTVLSYSGLTLRGFTSATTYTVVGVVCKMLSILLNEATVGEDKNNFFRLFTVVFCIGCSSLYRQAPLRADKEKIENELVSVKEEK